MLFNSFQFIFIFFPIVFAGMFWIGRFSHRLSALWLGLASLIFYSAWDSGFVLLLLTSICFNYGAGYTIGHRVTTKSQKQAKNTLIFAVAVNLSLLGYFKYSNFFIDSANTFFDGYFPALDIILPLGISFFTFTQIAYLVDVYRGVTREYNFIHYLLFVTYFPHLIAGPILHHKQMIPQFALSDTYRINLNNVAIGLSIFILGLAKKVLIADNLAGYATPVFNAADAGVTIMFFEAWVGALSYTLQLYFDFSAYCDMAIGLSLMLNIRLPMNFNSPYKATSIIDFWRRWHMTLSAFLRDYLYIPLGGNRKGKSRRYINLIATMLLGGLWHGAGWTFIIWGGLHGLYLMINHGWIEFKAFLGWGDGGRVGDILAGLLTFMAVVVAWVFFRSENISGAYSMLSGMAGVNGLSAPGSLANAVHSFFPNMSVQVNNMIPEQSVIWIFAGLCMVWMLPNLREVFAHYQTTWNDINMKGKGGLKVFPKFHTTMLNPLLAVSLGVLLAIIFIYMMAGKPSEFLYFQF